MNDWKSHGAFELLWTKGGPWGQMVENHCFGQLPNSQTMTGLHIQYVNEEIFSFQIKLNMSGCVVTF